MLGSGPDKRDQDPAYAKIVMGEYHWGIDDTNKQYFINHTEFELHTCSEEELGLIDGEHSLLYPPHKNDRTFMQAQVGRMLCID